LQIFAREALIILFAPEDARDTRAEEAAEEEEEEEVARTSRVRYLTPLIRQRSSSTRKSRTGSMTSPRPTSTWSRRAGQRTMAKRERKRRRSRTFSCATQKNGNAFTWPRAAHTRWKIKAIRGRSPKFTGLITRAFVSRTRVPLFT